MKLCTPIRVTFPWVSAESASATTGIGDAASAAARTDLDQDYDAADSSNFEASVSPPCESGSGADTASNGNVHVDTLPTATTLHDASAPNTGLKMSPTASHHQHECANDP